MKKFLTTLGGWMMAAPVVVCSLGCSPDTTLTTTSTANPTGGQTKVPAGSVVINEIQATVEDWIEIKNVGTDVADLSGIGLADKMANGLPEAADAVRFIDGEKLAPGEYLVVVANLKTAMPGPQTSCLATGGPARCYQAKWGISAANGDSAFLLYPDDTILDTITYPVNAVAMGQTYCRLPDGTGDPTACKPTPAAANSAP